METMDLAHRTAFNLDELEALFKFIPSSQLLKFRQVSKELDEVAQMVLRKRRDIKLILTTDNFDGRTNWEFIQFLNNSPETAFVAPVIHIQNANRSDQDVEGRICITFQIIQEICKQLGNRGIIRKLIIEDGENNAPHFTSDFVFALLSHLSSLETLEISELQLTLDTSEQSNPKLQLPCLKQITFGYKYEDCDVMEARNLLKIILESSPNLENISYSESDDKIRELRDLDLISLLRNAKHLSKMKEIIITKSADLDLLLQCQPKIELHSLEIETEGKDVVDSKKLFTFLQQQADNLKSFRCVGDNLVPKSIFSIPILPVLEELDFEQRGSGCLLSVNYGRKTPALKSLRIFTTDSSFHSWEEFLFYEISSEMPPCLSLEEMDLYINGGADRTCHAYQKTFDNWKNLFPNIKKLTVADQDEFALGIEQFSKCWPNLETLSLEVHGCGQEEDKDLDELVFGISPDWKKGIATTEENWWMKVPPEIKGTAANLKCLKELKVEVYDIWGTVCLTDFVVYFCLRHMQSLRSLEITSIQYAQGKMEGLSTEAFNFLVKNLPKLEKLCVLGQNWKGGEILK